MPPKVRKICSYLLCSCQAAMVQHLGPAILQIEVPVCDLNGFKCLETSVSHRYKYKHLKTALSNIPQRDPAAVNSKVGRTVRTPGCTSLHCEQAASGCSAGAALQLQPCSGPLGSLLPLSVPRVAGHFSAATADQRELGRVQLGHWPAEARLCASQCCFVITQHGGLLRQPLSHAG